MKARKTIAVALLATTVVVVGAACGSDDSSDATTEAPPTTAAPVTTAPPPEPDPPPAPPEPEPGLPAFTAGYQQGLKLNSETIPPNAAAPHAEFKNVFVNQSRATIAPDGTQAFPYPNGTVVTKEGSRGGDDAAIVAFMRKVAGADPEHGDWIFEEFSRTAVGAEYTPLASGAVCWTCHVNAEPTDWVYTTLK